MNVTVYPDHAAYRQHSGSLVERLLDVSPWVVSASMLALMLLTTGGVYLVSRKRELLLAERGQAEIYRVFEVDGSYEIAFGLGQLHGLAPGMRVTVCDGRGTAVGVATIDTAYAQDSIASVESPATKLRPGFCINRCNPQNPDHEKHERHEKGLKVEII